MPGLHPLRPVLAAAALPLALASAAPAAIIYQCRAFSPNGIFIINDPNESDSGIEVAPVPPDVRESEVRVGDTITFAGADRFVTDLAVRLWSFGSAGSITCDLELTIYQNAAGLPGAELWSGTLPSLTTTGTAPTIASFRPNLTLPDSVCFGLAIRNHATTNGNRSFGILAAAGPAIGGGVPVGVVYQNSATLEWRSERNDFAGGIFNNIDAVVAAVPAPGATPLLLAAALACTSLRRPKTPISGSNRAARSLPDAPPRHETAAGGPF